MPTVIQTDLKTRCMKRIHPVIYLFLLAAVLQTSCEKSDGAAAMQGTTVSGAGGSLAKFAIVGNYMYVVDWNSLNIFDISDPANPGKQGKVNIGFDIETIFPYKDKLFIGAMTGMYVYSIADPLKPVNEGAVVHVRSCDPVVSNDSVSYVTLRGFGTNCGNIQSVLNVYDIKNLKSPRLVKTVPMSMPYGLGIKQEALYVCDGNNGLVVFDLKDPYSPARKKEIRDDTFYDVIPYGNVLIAYINAGVCFYDIADPLNPVLLSKLKG